MRAMTSRVTRHEATELADKNSNINDEHNQIYQNAAKEQTRKAEIEPAAADDSEE